MAMLQPYDVLQIFRSNAWNNGKEEWLDFATLRNSDDFRRAENLVATGKWEGQTYQFRVRRGFNDVVLEKPAEKRTRRTARKAAALRRLQEQRDWIAAHGSDFAGYVARYGSADDPDHYGDGGEAIYEADRSALRELEEKWRLAR